MHLEEVSSAERHLSQAVSRFVEMSAIMGVADERRRHEATGSV